MSGAEQRNHARNYLRKAEEYQESAEVNLAAGRRTPAAGDAIHAGISAKDAIVTALTGATAKHKDHARAAKELGQALGARRDAAQAEKLLRELVSAKGEVEYGTQLVTALKAQTLVRRSRTLVELAVGVVRLAR